MSNYRLDFQEIKEKVKIEDAARYLGLDLKPAGQQFRAQCPACGGSERGLAITPAKGVYYCFTDKAGGDVIRLVAHIRGCGQKDAAEELAREFLQPRQAEADRSPSRPKEGQGRQFDAEAYGSQLDPDHDAVEAVGFPVEVAQALGLGFCSKGVLNGYVAVPLRLPDGTISAYIGIQEAKLPSRFNLTPKVVPIRRTA